MKWHLVDDFRNVITGRIDPHRMPRPKGWDLVIFVAGKMIFFSWAFVVPMLCHPPLVVLFYYGVAALVLGIAMSLVFQLPHCVPQSDFPVPRSDRARIETPWAVQQARVTLDFGRRDRVLTYFLGGLNYHKEHHLFPVISHVNYPGMSKMVQETCREFGVPYDEHPSFWAGIVSHYRWLKKMGMPEETG